MTPYFSVIVPTYKRARDLMRAVDSVLAQTFQDFEVVIINDDPVEPVAPELARSEKVRITNNSTNLGKSGCLMLGAQLAKGRYLAFLDDDDEWLPRHLGNFHSLIEGSQSSGKHLFYCPVNIRTEHSSRIRPGRAKAKGEGFLEYILFKRGLIQNSSIVLGREQFLGFDIDTGNRKHVDYDICMWAELKGLDFSMHPECTAIWNCQKERSSHRLSKSSPRHSRDWLRSWEQRRPGISAKVRTAFLASHEAPLICAEEPLEAMALLSNAIMNGYLSPIPLIRCSRRVLGRS